MDAKGMREILFRGKQLSNSEWVYGFIIKTSGTYYIIDKDDDKNITYKIIPETVGQYTGLCDKNGKKIFEGDIIDASNEWWNAAGPAGHDSPVILVEWENDLCGFEPFANYDCDCGVYINAKNCGVLGNIHDNPKLLKRF